MKNLLRIVFYLYMVSLTFERCVREPDYNEEMDIRVTESDYDEEMDIRSSQSKNTGKIVDEWNENHTGNPEELGHYFETDILVSRDRNGLRDKIFRWPKGVIPYEITGNFSTRQIKTIKKAFKEFRKKTCLRWVRRTNQDNWVQINNKKDGCNSYVGRLGGPQRLNLQSPNCLKYFGTVLHELMHTAGFNHEHTRPDRDSYVDIIFGNIDLDHIDIFNKSKAINMTDFGVKYDYGSVMHYSNTTFSKNEKLTIIPKKKGVDIGQRKGFSKGDIKMINKMYKCNKHLHRSIF